MILPHHYSASAGFRGGKWGGATLLTPLLIPSAPIHPGPVLPPSGLSGTGSGAVGREREEGGAARPPAAVPRPARLLLRRT